MKEPMEIVQELKWKNIKLKKQKRNSEYLNNFRKRVTDPKEAFISNPNKEILLLEAPKKEEGKKNISPGYLIKTINFTSDKITKVSRNIKFMFHPALIIGVIHVLLNAIIMFAVFYIVIYLLYFITVDVKYKIATKKEEVKALIKEAKLLYEINKCDPSTRVPALEQKCGEWQCLIKNGYSSIKYTKIILEMLGDLCDGFVSKFSIKSMSFIIIFLIAYLIFRR